MSEKKEVIFKVENLQTWFPITKGAFKKVVGHVKAVDDVSLEVYKGETLGIVGESGCGKSTFGKTLMMLEKATGGKVLFNYDGEFRDITKFNKQEMFALKTAEGRITLDGHIYKEFKGDEVEVRELTDAEMPWAYQQFGLPY